nr:MAG TPA: hypothetical protein [Caudoviricetes sp.]
MTCAMRSLIVPDMVSPPLAIRIAQQEAQVNKEYC